MTIPQPSGNPVPDDDVSQVVQHSEADLAALTDEVLRFLRAKYPAASWSFAGSVHTQDVQVFLYAENAAAIKSDLGVRYRDQPLVIHTPAGPTDRGR